MSTNEIIFLIIAVAIILLVIFVIKLLCRADKTLTKLNTAIEDLENKMKCVTPIFRVVSTIGEGLEYRAATFKKQQLLKSLKDELNPVEKIDKNIYQDLVDCALLGLSICKKFKEKKEN